MAAVTLVVAALTAVASFPATATSHIPTPGTFIDDAGVHEADIEAIARIGVTRGCGPARYCPAEPVLREQMAAFLVRALALPPSQTDFFVDDDQSPFEADINALAQAGVTQGCAVDRFCPSALVTREQMAAFLVRALALPPSQTDFFADDDQSPFEANINALAQAGVTQGCAVDRFCPLGTTRRDEMASFLRRALGLDPLSPVQGFGLVWNVDLGVSDSQVANIGTGFALAQGYLDVRYGGGIPLGTRQGSVVTVVATGTGEPQSGSAANANRLEPGSPYFRIFFDVLLLKNATDRGMQQVAVHEYVHAWHMDLGCLAVPQEQHLFRWMSEGIATWIAWETMVSEGYVTAAEADQIMLESARRQGALDHPLSAYEPLEPGSTPVHPGIIGYLAVDWLVSDAPSGLLALRQVCVDVASTGNMDAAFAQAFGQTRQDFYAEFDAWAVTASSG